MQSSHVELMLGINIRVDVLPVRREAQRMNKSKRHKFKWKWEAQVEVELREKENK